VVSGRTVVRDVMTTGMMHCCDDTLTPTRTYLLKLPTQLNLYYVELHRPVTQTDMSIEHFISPISATIKTKNMPVEFRFEVF